MASTQSSISLMNITNSIGLRTLPCCTPLVTFWHADTDPFTDTLCFLSDRKFLIQFIVDSPMPQLFNFTIRHLSGTLCLAYFSQYLGNFNHEIERKLPLMKCISHTSLLESKLSDNSLLELWKVFCQVRRAYGTIGRYILTSCNKMKSCISGKRSVLMNEFDKNLLHYLIYIIDLLTCKVPT